MEARLSRAALLAAVLLSLGASYRTTNFIVTAPTREFAHEVAVAAEKFRRDLAIEWTGRELPRWQGPCPITVQTSPTMGAGGVTSFMFRGRTPYGWTMQVQGTKQRILDSVLPHEITHTIFATHFGRPLPRWADEGACTTVEDESERSKHHRMLYQFLRTGRGIAFNRMFAMKEYPRDVYPLYAQGYSVARFLIQQGGKRKFVKYIGDGMDSGNWPAVTRKHYGYKDLSDLQVTWLDWVRRGSPQLDPSNPRGGEMLASAQGGSRSAGPARPPAEAASDRSGGDGRRQLQPIQWQPKSTDVAASGQAEVSPASGGWYLEQRDRAFAGKSEERDPPAERIAASDTASDSEQNWGHKNRPQDDGQVALSRAQAPQPTKQTVIEWGRPNPPAQHPPAQHPPAPSRPAQATPARPTNVVPQYFPGSTRPLYGRVRGGTVFR